MKLLKVLDMRRALQERNIPALNQHFVAALLETSLFLSFNLGTNFDRVEDNLDYFYTGESSPTQGKHLMLALNTGMVLKDALFPVVIRTANTIAELVAAEPTLSPVKINYELGTITFLEDTLFPNYISVSYASGFEVEEEFEIEDDNLNPGELSYGDVYIGTPKWLSSYARLHALDSYRQIKDWAGDAKQGASDRTRKPSTIAMPDRNFSTVLLEPHIRIFPTALWPINR